MTQVVPTLTIQLDENTTLNVEDASKEVKELVSLFDQWRQDESDQVVQLLKTRAALREMQQNIGLQLQKEAADAEVTITEVTE